MKKQRTNPLIAAALVAALAMAPLSAEARESNAKEASQDFGVGVVAVLANLVYMPVKVVYGVLGGVTGCFAYALSGANLSVAEGVWVPSLGGDYVLTTEMITGREEVEFNGVRRSRGTSSSDGGVDGESTF